MPKGGQGMFQLSPPIKPPSQLLATFCGHLLSHLSSLVSSMHVNFSRNPELREAEEVEELSVVVLELFLCSGSIGGQSTAAHPGCLPAELFYHLTLCLQGTEKYKIHHTEKELVACPSLLPGDNSASSQTKTNDSTWKPCVSLAVPAPHLDEFPTPKQHQGSYFWPLVQ